MWSRITFEKIPFSAPGGPCLSISALTHLFGLPLASSRNPLGLGTGVKVSVRAILRGANQQKWMVADGLCSLEIVF